jgi:hypothetical protein
MASKKDGVREKDSCKKLAAKKSKFIDSLFLEIEGVEEGILKERSTAGERHTPRKNKNMSREKEDVSDEGKYFSTGKNGRKYYDGLPVYTSEELNIGKGGNTKKCPVYCECCH